MSEDYLTSQQRELYNNVIKVARQLGIRSVTKTLHFLDNDVPRFIEKLKQFEQDSRNSPPLMVR